MGAEEEILVTLSGEAPWGFRLQGGAEHRKPLCVSKVRKRSKACRAGLCEGDELVSINGASCNELSHAQAMNLIDSSPGTLNIRVKRSPTRFQSIVLLSRSQSPSVNKSYESCLRALSPPVTNNNQPRQKPVKDVCRNNIMSPTRRKDLVFSPEPITEVRARRECLTSPPDSEAYYGETDSDADTVHEKQRRQKRRSPSSSPAKSSGRTSPEETSEMSGYESAPDARPYPQNLQTSEQSIVGQAQISGIGEVGVGALSDTTRWETKRTEARFNVRQPHMEEPSCVENSTENSSASTDDQSPQGATEVDSGFQELTNIPPLVSPDRIKNVSVLLSAGKHLVPMVGPVDKPVDEELTTTYMDKAKQAKLHRSESVQEKQVKEARTKCRTIASLLTDAPNPHSKGVLMFKKRRQRAKKYTLISYGSVEEGGEEEEEEEDGVFPTSESEFDEDGFAAVSDSAWDSDYLDILERKTPTSQLQEANTPDSAASQGLLDTSGKGVQLFEQQRKRVVEHTTPMAHQAGPAITPPSKDAVDQIAASQLPSQAPSFDSLSQVPTSCLPVSLTSSQLPTPEPPLEQTTPPRSNITQSSVLNRTARPFTPGFVSTRASTAPVVFQPNFGRKTPTHHLYSDSPKPVPPPFSPPPGENKPTITTSSLYIPPRQASVFQTPPNHPAAPIQTPAPPFSPPPVTTPTFSSHLPGSPKRGQAVTPSSPGSISSTSKVYSQSQSSEALSSREQRISVPASRTGILQEARRRSTKKMMFKPSEEKKVNSPNPELLSLVQNLDEKPKGAIEGGFESGPEEDLLNLGAEACNFMQAQKYKTPPPVAPKPHTHLPENPQLGGKGAELFARRQSRMDRFVVAGVPQPQLGMLGRPRTPSPTPSLPASWKYSPNIRAPPPIGYNPLLSPSCPPVAQRGSKAGIASKSATWGGRRPAGQKDGIKVIDFMRRQPYQLNPAMFSYGGGSSPSRESQHQSRQVQGTTLQAPRQVPVKAARVYEIRRFSTPTPMSAPTTLSPTVIAPRSATTLGEPLWNSEICPSSPPPVSPQPLPVFHSPTPAANPVSAKTKPIVPSAEDPPYASVHVVTPIPPPVTRSASSSSGGSLAPRPRFHAGKVGIQPNVWRPGSRHL
ncbi:synaptopodin 2-like protein [Erpetoichthys calabaricus]|uniref:synaptopodin 2-like protein n=1 Tax=Erpetoichthys calabaricus TaxID=27687 RepID=UPI00109EE989|nr:synaptopodin 2-like protein [Erpetoichthys calabaricus]